MRYNKGDRVVLRSERDILGGGNSLKIEYVDYLTKKYRSEYALHGAFDDKDIDHYATAELVWDDLVKEILGEPEPEPDSLSLTIKIHGAKAYRDKLEELHRHIETVERTIEQLNEMELSIEIED